MTFAARKGAAIFPFPGGLWILCKFIAPAAAAIGVRQWPFLFMNSKRSNPARVLTVQPIPCAAANRPNLATPILADVGARLR